jgi:hypothetical protein
MFRVINNILNPRIALFFMMALIFSPGMFHASASFLPSSFAMYTTFLGMSMFMNWRGGLKTAQGIFCFAVGGILGWPFSMALCAPFLIEETVFAFLSDKDAVIDAVMRGLRGVIAGILVLVSINILWAHIYPLTVCRPRSSWSQASFTGSSLSFRSTSSSIISSLVQEEGQIFMEPNPGTFISGISCSTSTSGLCWRLLHFLFSPYRRFSPNHNKLALSPVFEASYSCLHFTFGWQFLVRSHIKRSDSCILYIPHLR